MTLKNFISVIFAAVFFTNSIAQATVADFEYLTDDDEPFIESSNDGTDEDNLSIDESTEYNIDDINDENIELNPEYKEDPVYEEGENPPEIGTPPLIENEGLEFLVYHKDGVMAFAIIADHEKYQLRTVLAKNQIRGRATVSQMSNNIDDIAMINGGYFMISGSLIGVTKLDGEIIGVDDFYRSAIGIYDDGTTIFGRVRYQGEVDFYGRKFPINGVNCERVANSLVVYNSYFGKTTETNNFGVEILVENGIITDISYDKGNNIIPAGGYVISVHGAAVEFFKMAQIGDKIDINQKIFSEDGNFNEVPNIVGAGPRLIMDGKIFVTANEEKFPADIRVGRAPRSAVGVTSYGDYIFAVVDGRQAHSKGCTLQEWAEILLNEFGAVNAINLDGGGSTELFVKGSLVNRPSDGKERLVASSLAILPK